MTGSYRLLLAWEGGVLAVRSVLRVEMRAMPAEHGDSSGRASPEIELRSETGATLFRRSLAGAVPETVEYPTGDAERPFGRVSPPPGAIFSVVVPALPAARTAVLRGIAPRGGSGLANAAHASAGPGQELVVDLPYLTGEAGE